MNHLQCHFIFFVDKNFYITIREQEALKNEKPSFFVSVTL